MSGLYEWLHEWVHTFPKIISPNVNIIWVEFEPTYYDVAVQNVNDYVTATPSVEFGNNLI